MVVRWLPSAAWYFASVALRSSPFLVGWLDSYPSLSGLLGSLGLLKFLPWSLGCSLIEAWVVLARQAGLARSQIGMLVAAWAIWLLGMSRVGVWTYWVLRNPTLSPPFMTDAYALYQGLIGAAIGVVAIGLLVAFLLIQKRDGGPA